MLLEITEQILFTLFTGVLKSLFYSNKNLNRIWLYSSLQHLLLLWLRLCINTDFFFKY